jgi:CRP/FNR family transcriptional regulator
MIKNKHVCESDACFLCRTCLPSWAPAIQAHRQHVFFRKGSAIFREGDPVTGIFFITSGLVKIHKEWGGGKELILRFSCGGDILGHRGLGRDAHYPASATALTPLNACFVGLPFFQDSLRTNFPFMDEVLRSLSEDLDNLEERTRYLAHMPVKGRVAHALLTLSQTIGNASDGSFTLSRQDLASYAGTTYETVFRMLSELAAEKLISITGKDIRMLNVLALQGLARPDAPRITSGVPAPASASPLA